MRAVFLIILTAALASCGTVEGIGKDISSGAQAVQGWF